MPLVAQIHLLKIMTIKDFLLIKKKKEKQVISKRHFRRSNPQWVLTIIVRIHAKVPQENDVPFSNELLPEGSHKRGKLGHFVTWAVFIILSGIGLNVQLNGLCQPASIYMKIYHNKFKLLDLKYKKKCYWILTNSKLMCRRKKEFTDDRARMAKRQGSKYVLCKSSQKEESFLKFINTKMWLMTAWSTTNKYHQSNSQPW